MARCLRTTLTASTPDSTNDVGAKHPRVVIAHRQMFDFNDNG
jgi:hypothetical protein